MNKHKISIIYSWFIRSLMFFFPDIPIVMRVRGALYGVFMISCGKNFQVTHNAKITALTGVCVGDDVFIANNNLLMGLNITIEDKVLIGPNSVLVTTSHEFDGDSFRNFSTDSKPIIIKYGAWIGANCTVLRGSVLPSKSVLAAGSVLNKVFNKNKAVYGGIPAKLISSFK